MRNVKKLINFVPVLLIIFAAVFVSSLQAKADSTTATELETDSTTDGNPPTNPSTPQFYISPDGRYVYYKTTSTNITPNDTNGAADIFRHDRLTDTTEMLDVSISGDEANHGVGTFSVSNGGRYLVFDSGSTNLVSSGLTGIFLRDLNTGTTSLLAQGGGTKVVISGDGNWIAFQAELSGDSSQNVYLLNRKTLSVTRISNNTSGGSSSGVNPSINYDGSAIAFDSTASNLVSNDTNGKGDVFVWSKSTNSISLASVSSTGAQENNWSEFPSISGDGDKVVFVSYSTNLVSPATASRMSVYLHQMSTGATSLVDETPTGSQGNDSSDEATISEDGNYVTFQSTSSDLVSSDTNGSAPSAFVRDLTNSSTNLTSIDTSGNQISASSPAISADGQYTVFTGGSNELYLRY